MKFLLWLWLWVGLAPLADAVPLFDGKRRLEGAGLVVRFDAEHRDLAQEIFATLPGHVQELASKLALPPPPLVEVIVVKDRREAGRWTSAPVPTWSAALALPDQGRMLVQVDHLPPADRRELSTVLRHEALHLVFGQLPWHVRRSIPLWFEEGVAQVYAAPIFRFQRDELALRVQIWHSPNLAEWAERFPEDGDGARTAYLYSEAMVRLMVRYWGNEVIGRILTELERADSFGAAVVAVTGEPVVWHEARLHEELASDRSVYVRSLYGYLGGLGIFAISPLLVLGFARARRKRRDRLQRFEDDEDASELSELDRAALAATDEPPPSEEREP
ncbi:MAG: hypothetical protein JNM84_18755 [Planctomycetes bacterium]|nr:hypothetical protein [Planctomycetota bacterium]